jgi:hypothetical protein
MTVMLCLGVKKHSATSLYVSVPALSSIFFKKELGYDICVFSRPLLYST